MEHPNLSRKIRGQRVMDNFSWKFFSLKEKIKASSRSILSNMVVPGHPWQFIFELITVKIKPSVPWSGLKDSVGLPATS